MVASSRTSRARSRNAWRTGSAFPCARASGDLPGVIVSEDPEKIVAPFIEAIAQHRTWDRAV
jgi:hypothetical protein